MWWLFLSIYTFILCNVHIWYINDIWTTYKHMRCQYLSQANSPKQISNKQQNATTWFLIRIELCAKVHILTIPASMPQQLSSRYTSWPWATGQGVCAVVKSENGKVWIPGCINVYNSNIHTHIHTFTYIYIHMYTYIYTSIYIVDVWHKNIGTIYELHNGLCHGT